VMLARIARCLAARARARSDNMEERLLGLLLDFGPALANSSIESLSP
jgi:hypothetical protein